jgi:hypothetical protein
MILLDSYYLRNEYLNYCNFQRKNSLVFEEIWTTKVLERRNKTDILFDTTVLRILMSKTGNLFHKKGGIFNRKDYILVFCRNYNIIAQLFELHHYNIKCRGKAVW